MRSILPGAGHGHAAGEVVDLTQDSDEDLPDAGDGKSEARDPPRNGKGKPAKKGSARGKSGGSKGGKKGGGKGLGRSGKAIKGGRVSRFWLFTCFPSKQDQINDLQLERRPAAWAPGDPEPEVKEDEADWDPLEYWILKRAGTLGDPDLFRSALLST